MVVGRHAERPEATCLIAERRVAVRSAGAARVLAALAGVRRRRCGSSRSPASRAPRVRSTQGHRPVAKRRTMSCAGSTSSSGTGSRRRRAAAARAAWPARACSLTSWRTRRRTGVGAPCADRVLQRRDRLGVPQWRSPSRRHWYTPPTGSRSPRCRKARAWRSSASLASTSEADAADARGGAGEVAVDRARGRARPPRRSARRGRLDGRDAHLRDRLQQALADRLDDVAARPRRRSTSPAASAVGGELVERVEHQVRVHRAGAVADQRREVVHLARLARLEHEPGAQARALAHEVVVHGRRPPAATGSARGRRRRRGRRG